MSAEELKKRTQDFGLAVIRFVQALPYSSPTGIIGRQLMRCATSVGANFRAASRARSRPDFIARLKIVEEECDESIYWMELLEKLNPAGHPARHLIDEANQILSIIVASIRTARRNNNDL